MFAFLFNPDINEEQFANMYSAAVSNMFRQVRLNIALEKQNNETKFRVETERMRAMIKENDYIMAQIEDRFKKRRAPQKYTDMYLCKGESPLWTGRQS